MSTVFRKILVCLIAVFAMSAVASSAASAGTEIPEFKTAKGLFGFVCEEKAGGLGEYSTKAECEAHPGKQTAGGKWKRFFHVTITSKSGESKLFAGGNVITCKKDKNVGGLSSATTVWNVVFTFEECEATNTKAEKCKVNGGTIVTNPLTGTLGEIADPKTVGIDTESEETGKAFVKLTGACIVETSVTGSVICEVTPINISQLTGTINCKVTGTPPHQLFESIAFESGGALDSEDHLSAFGVKAAEETTDEVTYSENVEVNFTDSDET